MKPTRKKEYSVELKAQVSRRGKMVYMMECSIPAATMAAAAKMRQPFANAMIRVLRRSSARTSGAVGTENQK